VGVPNSRGDGLVPHKLLNGANVDSGHQKPWHRGRANGPGGGDSGRMHRWSRMSGIISQGSIALVVLDLSLQSKRTDKGLRLKCQRGLIVRGGLHFAVLPLRPELH
jgi:hypothetical protein